MGRGSSSWLRREETFIKKKEIRDGSEEMKLENEQGGGGRGGGDERADVAKI
jgi:hypothetical protein